MILPALYIAAVAAVQAATCLAVGTSLRMITPDVMVPKPITKIPPRPETIDDQTVS